MNVHAERTQFRNNVDHFGIPDIWHIFLECESKNHRRLAVAASQPLALALCHVMGALGGAQLMQLHGALPPLYSGTSDHSTRWDTARIIPLTSGESSWTTV